jgi:UDP:flavonoid glycosyltransferase YjiC (YdhE family)
MRELILCPADLELPGLGYEYEREVFYVEPSVDLERRPEGDFPWERIDPARRLIYCAFGSQMRAHPCEGLQALARALVGAVAEHPDWQLVLSTGGVLGPQDLPPLPGNAVVVEWAPQLALLERAAAAVVLGGLGTLKECVLLGVPMLVSPQVNDQLDNAERLVHHRLGLRIEGGDLDPRRLGLLLETTLEDLEIRGALARMQTRFRQIEDEGLSALRIEEVLQRAAVHRG